MWQAGILAYVDVYFGVCGDTIVLLVILLCYW